MKMKIKKIVPFYLAVLSLFAVSCNDVYEMTSSEIAQLSSSFVSIDTLGGSKDITINAKGDWTLTKVTTEKDKVEWLTATPTSGQAGESKITFTADKTDNGRTAEYLLYSGDGEPLHISIIQGTSKPKQSTVAEIIAGPEGKTYQVTGVCTSITNTEYGDWYLQDRTGTVYIYGTLDKDGNKKNFKSLNLDAGDEVTVVGIKNIYKGTVELNDVSITNINKSLIKVDSIDNDTLQYEGGDFVVHLTCKGQGVSVDIPEDAKNWLSISAVKVNSQICVVGFKASRNDGGDRIAKITFHTTDGKKDYISQAVLTQTGKIIPVTIAEFIAAPVSDMQYRISGVITYIRDEGFGDFYMKDATGETFIYNMKNFASYGLKVGDPVTVVGKRADYKGMVEMINAKLEK